MGCPPSSTPLISKPKASKSLCYPGAPEYVLKTRSRFNKGSFSYCFVGYKYAFKALMYFPEHVIATVLRIIKKKKKPSFWKQQKKTKKKH